MSETSTALELQPQEHHTSANEEELKTLVSRILAEAKSQGATAAEVGVGDDIGLSVIARDGDVETVEFARDRGFSISVYVGHRMGSTSTSDASEEAIEETVRAAMDIARYTEEDQYNGLADADRMATEFPDLDIYHPVELDVDTARDSAIAAEQIAMDYDERMFKSDGVRFASGSSCGVYGNSHGFLSALRGSRHSMSVSVIAKSENGMQRDYWMTADRDLRKMDSPASVAETAASRTILRLDPRPIPTGSYPVIFENQVAGSLIGHVMSALSGGALYRNASYLVDSMGKQVAVEGLTLREHPHLRGASGSRAFDGEGVATTEKTFIENGIVTNYVLSSYSGRRLGMPTTGNASGVSNLEVETERQSFEDLLRSMGTGLVVTELMGFGVNTVTGDYSRGAAGYWVENGEFAHAVDEITIAGKLDEIFGNLAGFGDDVDTRGNIHSGSILIESMTVAAN